MKNQFEKLYHDLKLARKKCPWANQQTLFAHVEELQEELDEVKQAIEKNDDKNLKEELGDVFMDAFFLMVIAEEKGIDIKETIKNVNDKLVRRKPWVFGDMKVSSKEEAIRIWNEIKKKEKEGE